MIQNERRILNNLDHPFVVKLFGTFQDAKRIYFVLEYVVGGELFSRLSKKVRQGRRWRAFTQARSRHVVEGGRGPSL